MIAPRHDEYLNAYARINADYRDSGVHTVQTDVYIDPLGCGVWMGTYVEYRQTLGHEDAIRAVQNDIARIEGRPLPFPPAPEPEPLPGRTGRVRLDTRVMVDDQGPYCALGASLFWAGWGVRHDRVRLSQNLRWLRDRGVQFVRVLGEVGGPSWSDRLIDPRDSGWSQQIRDTTTIARDHGMRGEWTLFGGGCLSTEQGWSDATDRFIDAIRPVLESIQLVEIQNEGQGPGREHARQLARRVRAQLGCLVAVTGTPEKELPSIYAESDANIMTLHCDRNPAERGYRPIRQIKHDLSGVPAAWVNNEPIGIASSVASESDPVRLAAGAITTWLVGAAAHVVHTGAGVYGRAYMGPTGPRTANVWEQPTLERALALITEAKRWLPTNLPNWSRKTHGMQEHPLMFHTQVGDAVEAGADGINRGYAAVARDGRWVCFLAGIQRRVAFTLNTPARLWSLSAGKVEHVGPGTYPLAEAEWGPGVLLTSE